MRFADMLKGPEEEGKEKHTPFLEVKTGQGPGQEKVVHVVVGKETPHPNTVEHHICWIELYGTRQEGQVINLGRAAFAPTYTEPNVTFHVPAPEQFKSFCAVCYCNIHGVWDNCIENG